MDNNFDIEILADGRIKMTSTGGFAKDIHEQAEAYLEMVKEMAGGEVETKKNKQHLHNPHHSHAHGGHHHHHHH